MVDEQNLLSKFKDIIYLNLILNSFGMHHEAVLQKYTTY